MPYEALDVQHVIDTVDRLRKRIDDRFPGSGLGRLAEHLLGVTHQASQRARWIEQPIVRLRIGVWFLIASLIGAGGFLVVWLAARRTDFDLAEGVQMLDAGTSFVIVAGGGVYFLVSLERWIKRRRALQAIHELRSLAHIIDMHQLTKDPERLQTRWVITPNSPAQSMTAFELQRYLDYCSEMLSLIGKVAAIYSQPFDDETALAAVNDVETLTTGLSQKIWQKIMVLRTFESKSLV